jgi:hypothetical protein
MIDIYLVEENIEVSFLSKNINYFYFKSELKNLTLDLAICKYRKCSDRIEKIIERQKLKDLILEKDLNIKNNVGLPESEIERIELQIFLYDDNLNKLSFCFDLGSNSVSGGKFYVRCLDLN